MMRKISFSEEKRILSLSGLSELLAKALTDIYLALTASVIFIFLSQPICTRQVHSYYFKCTVGRKQVWRADIDAFLCRTCKRGASSVRAGLTPRNAYKQNSAFAFPDYLTIKPAMHLEQVLSRKKNKICKQDYGMISAIIKWIWVCW